jgi:tRNA (guanine37-N1)-methyltransferase
VQGEKALVLANRLKVIDKDLEIRRNQEFIYLPLSRELSEEELKMIGEQVPDSTVSVCTLQKKKRVKTFFESLEDKLPPHLLASLPRALDIVGDIAIIEFPPELDPHKKVISKAILETHKTAKTVLAKAGVVSGTYRLREFTMLAGELKTVTIHKEYGCQYYVDLAKAYFSPRLSYEHNRVASLVGEGETIVDLFAGVGPFAVLIAKTHRNVEVYAVDVNPHAVEFLKKNIRLNRVEDKVYPILGDAKQVVNEKLTGVADRVIMNLPEKAIEFLDAASKALKPSGGIIHFYSFINASISMEKMKRSFEETVENHGRRVERILFSRLVRVTAPHEWQAVIDAKIR